MGIATGARKPQRCIIVATVERGKCHSQRLRRISTSPPFSRPCSMSAEEPAAINYRAAAGNRPTKLSIAKRSCVRSDPDLGEWNQRK